MNFDINQLLKGSVRDAVLDQITKSVGLPELKANSVLDRIVSVVMSGISRKTNSKEDAEHLLDAIKGVDSNTQQIYSTGATASDLGFDSLKQKGLSLLNSLFGSEFDGLVDQVSREEGVTQVQAKDSMATAAPAIFSSLKNYLGSDFSLANLSALTGMVGLTATGTDLLNKATTPVTKPATHKVPSQETVDAARMAGVHEPQYTKSTEVHDREMEEPKKSGIWKWLIILALILIALLLFRSCNKKDNPAITNNEESVVNNETTNNDATPPAPVENPDSKETKIIEGFGNFEWDYQDEKLVIDGDIDSAETKATLVDAFKGIAGTLAVEDKLDIDADKGKLEFTNFAALAGALKDFVGVDGKFDGKELKLSGTLNSEEAKANLVKKLSEVLGADYKIQADDVKVEATKTEEPKEENKDSQKDEVKVSKDLGDLRWNAKTDKVVVGGDVPSEEVKAKVLEAFKVIAGNRPLEDKLNVDKDEGEFSFNDFTAFAGVLKDYPTIEGDFDEGVLKLDGTLNSEDAKKKLATDLVAVLGSAFKVDVESIDVDAPEEVEGYGDLSWKFDGDKLVIDGDVSAEDKTKLLAAFDSIKDTSTIQDDMDVKDNQANMKLDSLDAFIKVVGDFPNVKGSFDGFTLDLTGHVISDERKTELVTKLQEALGSQFKIDADDVDVETPDVGETENKPVDDTNFPTPAEQPADQTAPAEQATTSSETAQTDELANVLDISEMSKENLDLHIVFDSASSDIQPKYNDRLDAFAKYLIESNRTGEISGYTDNQGDDESNKKLSAERANSVRNYLVSKGVPETNIVAVGYGEANPIADNNTPEGRLANRRIEFNVKDVTSKKDAIGEMINQTEDKAKSTYDSTKEKVTEAAEVTKEKVQEGYETAKDKVNKAADATKEAYKDAKETVSEAAGKAGEKIKDTAKSVGNAVDKAAHKTEDAIQNIKEKMGGEPSSTSPAPAQ
ncbi:OmpA family protein [Taylorella equigenitalis]|uniref:OmpA family protein n=1 Tax=Taylorella equigenitalis TaxID=29575 RepID=UPI000427F3E0|nr:OmpA family protein [Taylorella equigenitalis]ASY41273.1 flagellar motor protein MotB [Taylorella equigenitalis]